MEKKKILFYSNDVGGVNYYRIKTPAIQLDLLDNNKNFSVEINNKLDFLNPETINYLMGFDIIHYHRELSTNPQINLGIINKLKESGVKLVVDVDDHWDLHKNHPQYHNAKEKNHKKMIFSNLLNADYITTTTQIFADEIEKNIKKKNVFVFENSINPEIMTQFKPNKTKNKDGLVTITYMGGSTHLNDLRQLEGVVNILNSDPDVKNKFKIIIAGWDSRGKKNEMVFNENLKRELMERNIWNYKIISSINKVKGNINLVKEIPKDLKIKYQNNMFIKKERNIETRESVYSEYEKILTDGYKLIDNKEYYNWLMGFEVNGIYHNEFNYGRRWTKPPNKYATVLDETDIVIAPLEDNSFNRCKSELKQTECWTRKLPILCSDIAPYNIYGVHMKNCVLIPNKKNAKKYWVKYLKKLILDEKLRNELGNGLYNDFNNKFNLENVTKKRLEFYKNVVLNEK